MNDLTIRQETALEKPNPKKEMGYVDAIKVIDALAPAASGSRLFGMTNEQAKMVMLTGYELGMSLTGALRTIYVGQNGQVTLRPKGALGLIQSSGMLEKFEWSGDNNSQTVTMKRRGRPERHMSLTIQEAQKAGWKSGAWNATPSNMLRWRIIGWLADLDWTDLLLGLSIADDSWMDVEITPEGDVKPLVIEKQTPYIDKEEQRFEAAFEYVKKENVPDYGLTLPKLMELAADADILAANGGAYPMDEITVNAVAHKLILSGKLVLPNENVPNPKS